MIDATTISRIMDAAQIVEVVSDFVTLKKRGVNYIGLCPFHNEKTGSFTVSPAKGIFKCFGCGKGGNAVNFVMEHEQLSYVESLKYLAKKYHIEIQERELSDEEKLQQSDRESMFAVNEFAKKYFCDTLHNHIDGKTIGLSYFRERGLKDEIIRKFQLGFCLDTHDAFTCEALKNGYKKEFLQKTGLSIFGENNYIADRFRGRVIFPVFTLSGKTVAFGGRILKKDDKTAKYLNSPESEIYHKSNELYGLYFAKQAIVKQNNCFLVEGYTDVISMYQSGIENVVASSGTSLTEEQIRAIRRFTNNVTVLYDGDAAGIKASIRGFDMLLEAGMNIKAVPLPDGEDPDSFAQKNNADDFAQYIKEHQVDFIKFKTQLLLKDADNDPIRRAEVVNDVIKSIAIIDNRILVSEYIKECASIFNLDEKALYFQLNRARRTEVEKKENYSQPAASESMSSLNPDFSIEIKDNPFEKEEKDILYFIVRYAETEVNSGIENQNIKIGNYILSELQNDRLTFNTPLHKLFLDELRQHLNEPGFKAGTFFIAHPNPDVSRLAADLMTDKYTLSKIFTRNPLEEQLHEKKLSERERRNIGNRIAEQKKHARQDLIRWLMQSVSEGLLDYKKKILKSKIQQLNEQLKNNLSPDEMRLIMLEISELTKIQCSLAQELGRVII